MRSAAGVPRGDGREPDSRTVRDAGPLGGGGDRKGDAAVMTREQYRLLREIVYEHSGLSFGEDMLYVVERRLAPRLQIHGLPDFAAYHRFLRYDPGSRAEIEAAIEALTTHETYFYREPLQLQAFVEEVLPLLARENARQRRLRIWSAGCATGEEVYTIAILIERSGLFAGWDVDVFGSDISRRVLAVARAGAYGPHAFRNGESEALRPWFRAEGGKFHVRDEIRRLASFGHMNLLDPGATRRLPVVDAVFCRNVMIYLDLPARKRVLGMFHEGLREGGYLFLGHAESLLHITTDFEIVHLRHDLVYRKPLASL
jgi:chemotaxis protein methyltransferase CheR